jgi:hypothetical protein
MIIEEEEESDVKQQVKHSSKNSKYTYPWICIFLNMKFVKYNWTNLIAFFDKNSFTYVNESVPLGILVKTTRKG